MGLRLQPSSLHLPHSWNYKSKHIQPNSGDVKEPAVNMSELEEKKRKRGEAEVKGKKIMTT
jgi:hypothetical protein